VRSAVASHPLSSCPAIDIWKLRLGGIMTKKQLIDGLANVPNDTEIKIAFGCNFTAPEELSDVEVMFSARMGARTKIVIVATDEIDQGNLQAMNTYKCPQCGSTEDHFKDCPTNYPSLSDVLELRDALWEPKSKLQVTYEDADETPLTDEKKALLRAEIYYACKKAE
jgi:hypothetical protein